MSLSHRVSPPRLPACVPWKTLLLIMWRDRSTDQRACGSGSHHAVGVSRPLVAVFAIVDHYWSGCSLIRGTSPRGHRRREAASQRQRYAMGDETVRLWRHAQYTTHRGTSHTRWPLSSAVPHARGGVRGTGAERLGYLRLMPPAVGGQARAVGREGAPGMRGEQTPRTPLHRCCARIGLRPHRLLARRRLRLLIGGSSGSNHTERSCGDSPPLGMHR